MTKPTADSIAEATGFTGLQRQYIKAVAEEAATKQAYALRDELVQLIVINGQYNDADLKNRVSGLERQYEQDEKYTLTRPKIIAMMQKLGME
jgi:uncharacterized protein YihD (DUF1040 family)